MSDKLSRIKASILLSLINIDNATAYSFFDKIVKNFNNKEYREIEEIMILHNKAYASNVVNIANILGVAIHNKLPRYETFKNAEEIKNAGKYFGKKYILPLFIPNRDINSIQEVLDSYVVKENINFIIGEQAFSIRKNNTMYFVSLYTPKSIIGYYKFNSVKDVLDKTFISIGTPIFPSSGKTIYFKKIEKINLTNIVKLYNTLKTHYSLFEEGHKKAFPNLMLFNFDVNMNGILYNTNFIEYFSENVKGKFDVLPNIYDKDLYAIANKITLKYNGNIVNINTAQDISFLSSIINLEKHVKSNNKKIDYFATLDKIDLSNFLHISSNIIDTQLSFIKKIKEGVADKGVNYIKKDEFLSKLMSREFIETNFFKKHPEYPFYANKITNFPTALFLPIFMIKIKYVLSRYVDDPYEYKNKYVMSTIDDAISLLSNVKEMLLNIRDKIKDKKEVITLLVKYNKKNNDVYTAITKAYKALFKKNKDKVFIVFEKDFIEENEDLFLGDNVLIIPEYDPVSSINIKKETSSSISNKALLYKKENVKKLNLLPLILNDGSYAYNYYSGRVTTKTSSTDKNVNISRLNTAIKISDKSLIINSEDFILKYADLQYLGNSLDKIYALSPTIVGDLTYTSPSHKVQELNFENIIKIDEIASKV